MGTYNYSPCCYYLCQCCYQKKTVRIALILAALNDLEVKVGNVENSYITAPVREKVWTILGPEHGEDMGKKATIVRALYGLKSSGAAFRAHIC